MICWPQYGMHLQRLQSRALGGNILCLKVYWKTDAATLSRMDKGGRRDIQSTVNVYVSFASQNKEIVSAMFADVCQCTCT